MEQLISTILIAHCPVKDILQTKFAANYKKWKQRMTHIILSLSIKDLICIIGTFTHCAHDRNYISGLPP